MEDYTYNFINTYDYTYDTVVRYWTEVDCVNGVYRLGCGSLAEAAAAVDGSYSITS